MHEFTQEEQAANRAKLVAALRSGDYEQTEGRLRKRGTIDGGTRYCCLGVACKISELGEFENDTDTYVVDPDTIGGASDTHLPHPVRHWLGFASESGRIDDMIDDGIATPHGARRCLTDANDSGVSFNDIADAIEEGMIATV